MLAACAATPGTPTSGQRQVVEPVSCIAVLPVRMGVDEEGGRKYGDQKSLRKGAGYADTVLMQELTGNPKVRIVSSSQLNTEVMGGLATTIDQVSTSLNCEAVMVTTIWKFRQRQGGSYAVDEPASASFAIRLFNARTKNVIWAADFNETQESLLSNILSFGKARSRGFKWITVEELVAQGIKERLAECPYL